MNFLKKMKKKKKKFALELFEKKEMSILFFKKKRFLKKNLVLASITDFLKDAFVF